MVAAVRAPRAFNLRTALMVCLMLAVPVAALLATGSSEPPAPPAPSAKETSEPREQPVAPPPAPVAPTAQAAPEPTGERPVQDPEARVIEEMRAALATDPEKVLQLDDAASREFKDSPRSTERGLLRVQALVRLDRIGQARSLAEDLVERYPDDPHAQRAATYMGVHPRPRGPSR